MPINRCGVCEFCNKSLECHSSSECVNSVFVSYFRSSAQRQTEMAHWLLFVPISSQQPLESNLVCPGVSTMHLVTACLIFEKLLKNTSGFTAC